MPLINNFEISSASAAPPSQVTRAPTKNTSFTPSQIAAGADEAAFQLGSAGSNLLSNNKGSTTNIDGISRSLSKGTTINLDSQKGERNSPPGSVKNTDTYKATQGRAPYAGGLADERKSFVLTSDVWMEDKLALVLHAGPSEAQWSVPIRASFEDTKGGRAHYTQARSIGGGKYTHFNLPTISFTFQTGNILPIPTDEVRWNGTEVAPIKGATVPYGLQDFYYFMQLIDQSPLVLKGPNEGKHNYLWVYYRSTQFPEIVLKGYIEPEGVSWADSAENPNGFTWSATMAVYESSPDITDTDLLFDSYLKNVKVF